MDDDSRPWGIWVLVLFTLLCLGYRRLVSEPSRVRPGLPAAAPGVVPLTPRDPALRALLDGRAIDVNTASDAALQQLPGIGPGLSARIRQARERTPFRDARDLRRVRGLGAKKVARLAPLVRFGP